MSAEVSSIHFAAWLASDARGAKLAKHLIEISANPELAKAICEIGYVEGCVHGAESVGKRVKQLTGPTGAA